MNKTLFKIIGVVITIAAVAVMIMIVRNVLYSGAGGLL
jgi:hypothetical protein